MKVTKNTIINLPEKDRKLIQVLLEEDLQEIIDESGINLYIDYQDWHDEYSSERTDPCPDYFGTYSIWVDDRYRIGEKYSPKELDSALYLLGEFLYVLETTKHSSKSNQ